MTDPARGVWVVLLLFGMTAPVVSLGKPEGPRAFCEAYPDSPACDGSLATCEMCHTSTSPGSPAWNSYGLEILYSSYMPPFEAGIVAALPTFEGEDSDGDGVSNADEIALGTHPGDPESNPVTPNPPSGAPNPGFNVEGYDMRFALRRVVQVYCGRSPTFDEMQTFDTSSDPYGTLHGALDSCLESEYWIQEALARMGDPAIRPIDFTSAWGWDYRLFRYVMSGDRDMRDLLLAQYAIRELDGEFIQVEGPIQLVTNQVCDPAANDCPEDQTCQNQPATGDFRCQYTNGGLLGDPSKRAGMITTAWFHFYNTMFAAMPRQTAAQAYRSYLGMDIARQEGLLPVPDEPVDYDQKGVQEAECAQCHSTLDPLSYPFAYYNGIGGGPAGAFNANRPVNRGLWAEGEAPPFVLLGVEVADLLEWAAVAAESEHFKRQMTLMFFRHALGRAPLPEELPEFTALWKTLPEDNYSANALNHRLIDTLAFGGP